MQGHLASGPWAVCRSGCFQGRHVTDEGGRPWTCEKLGERTPGKAPKCSAYGENCISSHCCRDIGLQCYQKDAGYATCKPNCSKVMDPLDKDSDPWTCKELGTRRLGRAPWVSEECSEDFSDCRQTKCCKITGSTCFERDEQWATCQDACTDKSWSCKPLGPPMPMREADALERLAPKIKAAPWVKTKCAAFGSNCMDKKCCMDAGAMCYKKDSKYASCKWACVKGTDPADGEDGGNWSCDEVGPRTPGKPEVRVMQGGSKAAWVEEKCSDAGADCSSTQCCKEEGFQCLKDGDKTTCRAGCYQCEALGAPTPREWSEDLTFFCWLLVTKGTYEVDIMREQLRKRAGIFACEEQAMMTHDEGWTLDDELGGEMMPIEEAEVGVSKDGTAGNSLLFINAWDAVLALNKWQRHDWTIKTDPDALIVPDRLRASLAKVTEDTHLGEELFAYVKTCHKDNGMKNMMFGAMEALTKVAVKKYAEGVHRCRQLDWKTWGEDLFLMNCMDNLGAIGMDRFSIVSDDLCNGLDCGDPAAGVFHPMKTVDSWNACYEKAVR
ncbi:unnamed protein product [Prorocentrum cordatum]|uniref:Hexosyltransferase n=1 Tax=Prorocentrum cordatum TaxID=2364126 RepID=A0ABN9S319_9DINO|nr:unnamed protein product [Polarella glacialis]